MATVEEKVIIVVEKKGRAFARKDGIYNRVECVVLACEEVSAEDAKLYMEALSQARPQAKIDAD